MIDIYLPIELNWFDLLLVSLLGELFLFDVNELDGFLVSELNMES